MTVYPLMRYRWCYLSALGAVTVFALLMVFVSVSIWASSSTVASGPRSSSTQRRRDKQVGDVRAAFGGVGVTARSSRRPAARPS